jgi:UDP-2,3-diacylglucosamine hydrolase
VSVAVALPSVRLRDPVFISDLHLAREQPDTVQAFLTLAGSLASGRELVILGDLFEYWAGDDEAAEGIGALIGAALQSLTRGGTPVYLMRGNRDVLLGEGFARATGVALLDDPSLTVLAGVPTLLAHGDAYCTLDSGYQAFRRRARDPRWQRLFLRLPLALRRAAIGELRRRSEAGKKTMAPRIMDVTPEAIEQALRSAGVRRMIHGHTHRPARHHLAVDGQSAERWVLPDWDLDGDPKRGGYLQVRGGALEAVDLASAS